MCQERNECLAGLHNCDENASCLVSSSKKYLLRELPLNHLNQPRIKQTTVLIKFIFDPFPMEKGYFWFQKVYTFVQPILIPSRIEYPRMTLFTIRSF